MGLTIIGAIAGAIVGSLLTWYLQRHWTLDRAASEVAELRKEVSTIRDQFASFKQAVEIHGKEELEWSERFERLARQLSRVSPSLQIVPRGGSSAVHLYPSIFLERELQDALQAYVVQNNGAQFFPRSPRPDELRRRVLREGVQKAEQRMAAFQDHNPNIDLKWPA